MCKLGNTSPFSISIWPHGPQDGSLGHWVGGIHFGGPTPTHGQQTFWIQKNEGKSNVPIRAIPSVKEF